MTMSGAFKMDLLDGTAVLTFDLDGSKVNILTMDVIDELEGTIGDLESTSGQLKGVIIISGKEKNFIAGADLTEIEGITDPEEGAELARRGQAVMGRLEKLPFPAINGSCLGGGLELALACRYRVVTDYTGTFLGLPETQLGIIPGFGGTQRLPRTVGIPEALKMITTGSRVYARRAVKIGLAHEMVVREHLLNAARRLVEEGPDRAMDRRRRGARSRGMQKLMESTGIGRKIIFDRAKKAVQDRTGGHYPAPMAAVRAVEEGLTHGLSRGYSMEARLLGEMAATDVCKNLIRVFYLRESFARGDATPARDIGKVTVIGAGVMGTGIATLAVERDMRVRILDLAPEALGKALKSFHRDVEEKRKRSIYTGVTADWIRSRLTADTSLRGMGGSDVVIEAVAERMDVKRSVFATVADAVHRDAIIASNTSSLSITEMAADVPCPDRVAGLHFFNPVDRMPLVEVIRGENTSDGTVEKTAAFARRLGKVPIVVKDRPGFLVNRLLLPYMNEAATLLEEGAGVESLDRAMLRFGMPMGVFILLDQVGIDIAAHAARSLHEGFGDRMTPSPVLDLMLKAQRLGRKTGKGFYAYSAKGERSVDSSLAKVLSPAIRGRIEPEEQDIVERLIYPMINEASRCLEEKVVQTPEAVDAAMILGAGFPPFTAGLLAHADAVGAPKVIEVLEGLTARVDARFEPSDLLRDLAAEGRRFYP